MQGGSPDLDVLGMMVDEGKTAHEILGLPRSASDGEVREAYIRLAKEYHPDKHLGDLAAERRFKRVNAAYNELHQFRGLQKTYQGRKFTRSYGQVLAFAVAIFVTPLAIFLFRSGGQPAPSLELRQPEGVASREIRDAGGTALLQRTAIERPSVPSPPQERTAALKFDGIARSTSVPQGDSGDAEASPMAAAPREEARVPGVQVPASHNAIADAAFFSSFWSFGRTKLPADVIAHSGRGDIPAPALGPQAPPRRNKVTVARTIIPSKMVNAAAIGPAQPAQSASAALLEDSLDRIVLAAAPGG